jgi:DNA-binding CsgD family transcriptional regulator
LTPELTQEGELMARRRAAEREIQLRQREETVMRLRRQGASYAAIGNQLGISAPGALKIWRRATLRIPRESAEEELRVSLQRCDSCILAASTISQRLQAEPLTARIANAIARQELVKVRWEELRLSILWPDRAARLAIIEGRARFTLQDINVARRLLDEREREAREHSMSSQEAVEATATPAPEQRRITFDQLQAAREALDGGNEPSEGAGTRNP